MGPSLDSVRPSGGVAPLRTGVLGTLAGANAGNTLVPEGVLRASSKTGDRAAIVRMANRDICPSA